MNFKKDFNKIYKRALTNAILKSLVYSILSSATVLAIMSFFFWVFDVKQYWISLIVFGVLEVALFLILFSFFKPNEKALARKLDELGLQQRVITMQEFANDDSLMAKIQRQNAIEHINKVDTKLLKVVFPVVLLVFVALAVCLGAAGTTVSALSAHGVIKNGKEVIEEVVPEAVKQYEVMYDVDGEGYIEGELFQVVKEGEDAEAVQAIAEDGWAFTQWSDGVTDPYRQDLAITSDLEIYAEFAELDEEQQDQDGDGEGDGEDGEESDGQGEPQESDSDSQGNSENPSDNEGGGEGGKYDENNQVIDGETYIGDVYDQSYSSAIDGTQGNSSMSDGEKSVIEDYFKNIEK